MAKLDCFVGSELFSDVLISSNSGDLIPAHEIVIGRIPFFETYMNEERVYAFSENENAVKEYAKRKYKFIMSNDTGKRLVIPVPYSTLIIKEGLKLYYSGHEANRNMSIRDKIELMSFYLMCGQPNAEATSINIDNSLREIIKTQLITNVLNESEMNTILDVLILLNNQNILTDPEFLKNNINFMSSANVKRLIDHYKIYDDINPLFYIPLLIELWKGSKYGNSLSRAEFSANYVEWLKMKDIKWLISKFKDLEKHLKQHCSIGCLKTLSYFDFIDNSQLDCCNSGKSEVKDINSICCIFNDPNFRVDDPNYYIKYPIDCIKNECLSSSVLESKEVKKTSIIRIPKGTDINIIAKIIEKNPNSEILIEKDI